MKNLKLFALLVALSTLFMGCPYSTEVPIDNANIKIDQKLLGKWESKSSSTETYNIHKADEYTYKITKLNSSSPTDTATYMAYLSEINGIRFFNIWELAASTKTYYLYKLELSGSGAKITMSPVTENIEEKFTTSADLKKFVQTNMGLSFFYSKDKEEYIRAD